MKRSLYSTRRVNALSWLLLWLAVPFAAAQSDAFTIDGGQAEPGVLASFDIYFRDVAGTPIDTGTIGVGAFRMSFTVDGSLIESAEFVRGGLILNANILVEDQVFDPSDNLLQWSVAFSFSPPPFVLNTPAPGDLIGELRIVPKAGSQGQTITLTPRIGSNQFFVQDELGAIQQNYGDGFLTGFFGDIAIVAAGGGDPPSIQSFTASPSTINSGESATLSWSVTDADTVSIDRGVGPVAPSGSQTVSPAQTSTYTLTAVNQDGSSTRTATVTVAGSGGEPPNIQFFNLEPNSIAQGESATLSWSVQNADSVSIDQGIGGVSAAGVRTVSPQESTTYRLTASNQFGTVDTSATLAVGIAELTIDFFIAEPSLIDFGDPTTLSWLVFNADTVEITPDIGLVLADDTVQATPTETTTYTLTAKRGAETATTTTTVFVTPLPEILSFTATPPEVPLGETTRLNWETANATSVSMSRTVNGQTAQFGNVALNGGITFRPSADTTYTLTATRDDKSDTASVEVRIAVEDQLIVSPATLDFGADLDQLTLDVSNAADRDLSWSVAQIPAWLSVDPDAGVATAQAAQAAVTLDRGQLQAGLNNGVIRFQAGAQNVDVAVTADGGGDSEFAFSLLRADADFETELGLINLDAQALDIQLDVINADGSASGPSQTFSLQPLETYQGQIGELGPGMGWARVTAMGRPQAKLAGYANVASLDGEELYAYALTVPETGPIRVPHVARDVNFFTLGSLVNAGAAADDFNFSAAGDDQFAIGALGGGQQSLFDFRDELMGGEVRGDGWGDLTTPSATAPMAAVEVFGRSAQTGLRQTVAVTLDGQSGQQLIFPHLAANIDVFWTGVVIINAGADPAETSFQIYNQAGEAIDGRQPETFAPGEKKTFLVDGNVQAFGLGAAWLTVSSDQPLLGYMLFGSYAPDDRFSGFQSVKSGSSGLCFPYLDLSAQPEGYTGIALVNLSDVDGSVQLRLVDQFGAVKAQRDEPLAKKQKFVGLAKDLFAEPIAKGDKIFALGTTSLAGFEIFGLGAKTLGGILALAFEGDD